MILRKTLEISEEQFLGHFEVALQSRSVTVVKMALLKCSHHFLRQQKLHVDSG